jgi:L-threonylcarbamoyladenylate synthase
MKEKLELANINDRKRIARYLKEGKIGLFPTDTVWGICSRMDNKASVERVFEIKNREKNKPFLILASDIAQVQKYVNIDNPDVLKITEKYWPGPLTIIFNAKKESVLSAVRAGGETIAARIPDYNELAEIISEVGTPLIAPSANISGENPPVYFDEIDGRIINAVDFIVQGECKMKEPSTIIDCTQSEKKIVREGAVKFEL